MGFLEELLGQIHKWPISVAIVVAMSFVGIVLKRMALFNVRYIPAVLMVACIIIYPMVSNPGSIGPEIPYPDVVFGIYGLILGVIAWLGHGLVWKFISEKIPGLENGIDSKFTKKPSDPDK